ncbi:MAG: histone deacetylase [Elusimicrobiota bacterium]|nr:histone deacetylase [Elusimicrobiota bacterium]
MKPRVVYSPAYDVSYEGHAFAPRKFALAAQALAPKVELVEPSEPAREDLLRVHSPAWVDKLYSAELAPEELLRLELPFTPAIARAHRLAAGGTTLAARHALERGVGLHCGGGAHHACRDHGEGYCAVNDLAVAVRVLQAEGRIKRAAIIDLDVHQGNGTADAFAGDPSVFTFSMHQGDLYPIPKAASSLDIELRAGTGDAEYYDALGHALPKVFDSKPDLVVYQAGVDVWEKDRLGGLKLTELGVRDRDGAVREACRAHGVPVVVTLGGGYGPTPDDTARLHAATLRRFAGIS